MKIGSIDFAGFGNLSGQKLELDPAKLNIVLESEVKALAAIKAAVWACLFGFPRVKKLSARETTDKERYAPATDSDLPYIAGIDISGDIDGHQRQLKIIREFADEVVQVVDLGADEAEVTAEFIDANNNDRIGMHASGMSREIFRKLCYVNPSELADNRVGSLTDLTRVVREWVHGEAYPKEPRAAAMALEEALAGFPYQGRNEKSGVVLRDLEGRYYELSDKVHKLERERKKNERSAGKKSGAEGGDDTHNYAVEYLDLCNELADIDVRSIKSQETLQRVQHLRAELQRIGSMAKFPLELQKPIEELWIRRQSRKADYDAAFLENNPKIKDYEVRENRVKDHFYGLDVFTKIDADILAEAASKYQKASEESVEARMRMQEELEKLEEQRFDLHYLEPERRLVLSLEPQEYDDARHYSEILNATLLQSLECEKTIWRYETLLKELDEKRVNKKKSSKIYFLVMAFLCVFLGAVLAIVQVSFNDIKLMIGIGALLLAAFGGCVYFSAFAFTTKLYKITEYKGNQQELSRQKKLHDDLDTKMTEVTARISTISEKTGLSDVSQFMDLLHSYLTKGEAAKNLDMYEQMLIVADRTTAQLKEVIEPYFHRCGRYKKLEPDDAVNLASEIRHLQEETQNLNDNSQLVKQARQQLEFLAAEVKDVDQQIIQACSRARVENLYDAQEAYREYYSKVATYHHWHALQTELKRLETDMSSGFVADELPPQIERLERQRREKLTRMQVLVLRNPQLIQEMPILDEILKSVANVKAQAAPEARATLEQLRVERDFLTTKMRSINTDDEGYQKLVKQLSHVQHELNIVRRVKNALENAKDKIYAISTKENWLEKVIAIVEDMLMDMGVELEKLDGFSDSSDEEDADENYSIGKTFSLKTIEQVRWFARLISAKVLGMNEPFVLILDEALGNKTEAMRPENLSFLLDLLGANFQLILLLSNQNHYKAAFSAVDPTQRSLLLSCGRSNLT